jgi:esterase FrsA
MYTYDIAAADIFEDRTHQFEKFGIPLDDIKRIAAATTDMWADAPVVVDPQSGLVVA